MAKIVKNEVVITSKTTYNHNFIYQGTGSTQPLDYMLTPEGLIKNPASLEYHYFINDHLGNTRPTLTDANGNCNLDLAEAGEVLQTADYYLFGMEFAGMLFDSAQGPEDYVTSEILVPSFH